MALRALDNKDALTLKRLYILKQSKILLIENGKNLPNNHLKLQQPITTAFQVWGNEPKYKTNIWDLDDNWPGS